MIYPGDPWLEWSCRICPLGRCKSNGTNSSKLCPSKVKTAKSANLFLILNNVSFGVVLFGFFLLSSSLSSKSRRNICVNCGI